MSTTLPIEGYIVDISDGRNWTLKRPVTRTSRDTKEEYEGEDVIGYYGSLQSACRALFREQLGNAGSTTIPKLTKYVEEAENKIIAAVTALQKKGEIPWPAPSITTPVADSGLTAASSGSTPTTRRSRAPRMSPAKPLPLTNRQPRRRGVA